MKDYAAQLDLRPFAGLPDVEGQYSSAQHFQVSGFSKQCKRFVSRNRGRGLIELLTFVALPPAITSEYPTIRQ
jgi:hypothetical protein